jgi:hypothetical protein
MKTEMKQMESGRYLQTFQMDHQKKPRYMTASSPEELTAKIAQYEQQENARRAAAKQRILDRNAKEREDNAKAAQSLKIGDIFYNSWGYDQTNIDFYQIIGICGKMAEMREICQRTDMDHLTGPQSMSEYVLPCPNQFKGDSFKKIIKSWSGTASFSMRFGCCTRWEGRSLYQSHYA